MDGREHAYSACPAINILRIDTPPQPFLPQAAQDMGYTHILLSTAETLCQCPETLKPFIDQCHRQELAVLLGCELSSPFVRWLDEYHADGLSLRGVDAFIKPPQHELPDADRLTAVRELTASVRREYPAALLIAEECEAFPAATLPVELGGLGFDMKHDTGWRRDMLEYFGIEPMKRRYFHDLLTNRLCGAFTEHSLLALDDDIGQLISGFPDDPWQRMATLRMLYAYAMAHPGKKQLSSPLALQDERLHACVKALYQLYLDTPALANDRASGFRWIVRGDVDNSVLAFLRTDNDRSAVLCVFNFTSMFHPVYRVGLPHSGSLTEIINTDRTDYGGSGLIHQDVLYTQPGEFNGFPHSAEISVPPLGCVYFRFQTEDDRPASQAEAAQSDHTTGKGGQE